MRHSLKRFIVPIIFVVMFAACDTPAPSPEPITTTPAVVSVPDFTPEQWAELGRYLHRLNTEAAARNGDIEAIKQLIRWRFGSNADRAIAIAWRESRLQPRAANPSGCRGLFQLALPLHHRFFERLGVAWQSTWFDPVVAIDAAFLLFSEQGWAPWRF